MAFQFIVVHTKPNISNEVMSKQWTQRFGKSYYHFAYRDVLFLCLNTEDTQRRCISNKQIEHFKKVLKANRNVRWTFVFMHQPVWKNEVLENWQRFESLLAGRPYTVFTGHSHEYSKSVRKGRRYYVLATTGGTGGDNKSADCQFDHIVWVTMTDDGPVMANLLLEGIADDEPCTQ